MQLKKKKKKPQSVHAVGLNQCGKSRNTGALSPNPGILKAEPVQEVQWKEMLHPMRPGRVTIGDTASPGSLWALGAKPIQSKSSYPKLAMPETSCGETIYRLRCSRLPWWSRG